MRPILIRELPRVGFFLFLKVLIEPRALHVPPPSPHVSRCSSAPGSPKLTPLSGFLPLLRTNLCSQLCDVCLDVLCLSPTSGKKMMERKNVTREENQINHVA